MKRPENVAMLQFFTVRPLSCFLHCRQQTAAVDVRVCSSIHGKRLVRARAFEKIASPTEPRLSKFSVALRIPVRGRRGTITQQLLLYRQVADGQLIA